MKGPASRQSGDRLDDEFEQMHVVVRRPGDRVERGLSLVLDHEIEIQRRHDSKDLAAQTTGQETGRPVDAGVQYRLESLVQRAPSPGARDDPGEQQCGDHEQSAGVPHSHPHSPHVNNPSQGHSDQGKVHRHNIRIV